MKRFFISIILLVAGALAGMAQQMPELPMDPAVRKGVLDNGMTYYIRHNELPAGRAEFYLATNVGAIQEAPDQDGLAHFLEHMCFNGTKNFPGKGIINYLESIGASFGGNVNASTGVESTQYMLNNIPLVRETVVDTCLLIMHDYSHFVTCDPAEIDSERGVILEEKRTRNDASWRMYEALRGYLFKGTKYVGCSIIGSEANLKTFKPESLTSFYHTWYRPDMQALIVVGDVDVERTEAKIKDIFSDIPAPVDPRAKDIIEIPGNQEPIIGVITDPEASSSEIDVVWKTQPIPEMLNSTPQALVFNLAKMLVRNIMSERLGDIAARPDAPFLDASFGSQKLCETMTGVILGAQAESGKSLEALEAALTEVLRMRKFGFTEDELQRAKSEIISQYESLAKKADTRKNADFVRPIINNFFDNTDLMTPQDKSELVGEILGQLDVNTLNQFASQLIPDDNMIVVYEGPDKTGVDTPTEEQIAEILSRVESADIQPLEGETISSEFVDPTSLKAQKVKKSREGLYGSTEWTLRNGAKVVLLPTSYEKDKVNLYLYKEGGLSLVEDADMPSFDSNILQGFGQMSGVSKYSRSQVDKMLSGKQVRVTPFYSDIASGFIGSTTRRDIETALQLLYLDYTDPRFDQDEYDRVIKSLSAVLPNVVNQPDFILEKEMTDVLYGGHPRQQIISEERLAQASMQTLERVVKNTLYKDAAGVVLLVVGDFDIEEIKPLIERYIGNLPKGKSKNATKWMDRGDEPVDEAITDDFKTAMTTPKVTVAQIHKLNTEYSVQKTVDYAALDYIINMVYTATLREEEGGTYGAHARTQFTRAPKSYALMQVSFDTNPEQADRLRDLAIDGLRGLAENGPTEEQFDKTIKNLRKKLPESKISNNYWLGSLRTHYMFGNDPVTEYEAALDALTPERIQAAAADMLGHGSLIEFVMRPE